MKKFINLGFVVGHKSPFIEQAYVAYKVNPYLTPITDREEMPFQLEIEAEINISSVFPLKAKTGKIVYRHSAYVKSRFEIIHIIYEYTKDAKELCYWTVINDQNWMNKWKSVEPSLSENLLKPKFFGFLETNGFTYSVVKLENDSFNKQSLLSYTGKGTFVEEVYIHCFQINF